MDKAKKLETQEEVKRQKVSGRFLLALSVAFRMKAIGTTTAVIALILVKNGFTNGEADEAIEQVNTRWNRLTDKEKRERQRAVQMRQLLKDTGLRRAR